MTFRATLLDLLFPKRCAACGIEDCWLCSDCRGRLPLRLRHLPRPAGMGFDDAYALLPFDVPWVKRTIHDVKFGGTFGYLEAFGDVFAERLRPLAERLGGFSSVTHVPLATERRRRRGFDQAERLAADIARHLEVPHRTLLTRNRVTAAQAELGGGERRRNTFAAFDPTPELFIAFVATLDISEEKEHPWKSVLLVDDVLTTGATLSSAAKILKAFGVERVTAVAIGYRSDEHFLARFKRRNIDWWPAHTQTSSGSAHSAKAEMSGTKR